MDARDWDDRDWDDRYAETDLVWSAGPNVFVAASLADVPPGRAVDVAAGEGRNAIWLAERGWQVTAVDFSRVGIDKARTLQERRADAGALDIAWMTADVLTYDPPRAGYDLALLAYLQLAAEQRRAAVRRAFGWLRDGGRLFVVAHDSSNLTDGTGGPQDPEVLFTAEDVLADLDGERFEVVEAARVARQVPAAEDAPAGTAPRTAYDALVHLVRTDPR